MALYPKNISKMIQVILYCLFIPMMLACSKEKQIVIENNWQVESIKVHADSTLQYPAQGKIYTLTFEDKKRYILKLDVNKCSGEVRFKSNSSIDFTDTGCTEICCDSDFAEILFEIFSKANHYNITNATLILTGENGKVINLVEI